MHLLAAVSASDGWARLVRRTADRYITLLGLRWFAWRGLVTLTDSFKETSDLTGFGGPAPALGASSGRPYPGEPSPISRFNGVTRNGPSRTVQSRPKPPSASQRADELEGGASVVSRWETHPEGGAAQRGSGTNDASGFYPLGPSHPISSLRRR